MSLEIEMKARVLAPTDLAERLRHEAEYRRDFFKRDEYFRFPAAGGVDPGQNLRLRQDGAEALVTWKERRREGALEVNREREFSVSSAPAFVELILEMGAVPYFEKQKRGQEFRRGGLCLELCEVPPLGFFLEIEKLIEPEAGADLAAISQAARAEIAAAFAQLGLGEGDFETKSYSELLRERA
jgi:predicted adenylyl cyclase CyaB